MKNTLILLAYILFVCLFLVLAKFLKRVCWTPLLLQYKLKKQGIKGPPYKFLHGNINEISAMRKQSMVKTTHGLSHNIFPKILPHVHSWTNLYGKNYLNWKGSQAELVVTQVELVAEILSNKEDNYPKLCLKGYAKKLLGDGLSSSEGEKWAKMRKLANHVFHADSLKSMISAMITSNEIMLEKWKNYEGEEIEVFQEFRVLTSEVISRTAFGSSYLEGKNMFDMLMQLTLLVSRNMYRIRFPFLSEIFKSSDDSESEKLEKGIKECIREMIQKREMTAQGEGGFLEKLMEAGWMTEDDIVDECKTFYFAGHETSTSLLTWTMLLLATHQEWQDKAREEVLQFFGKNNPNSEGISRLKIMNMIIEESLRLYPPIPFIKRRVFKEVRLGNMILPPKLELYISPLVLHHDPIIWGENVHQFNPERFAKGVANATITKSPAAFLPFGYGPRTCVGLNFAIIEAKIALAMILQRFVFTLSPTYVHLPVQIFSIRPQHGVHIVLHAI